MAYSHYFIKKVLKLKSEGMSFIKLSKKFNISVRSVQEWLNGNLPKGTRNKPNTKLNIERLKQDVIEYPDSSLKKNAKYLFKSNRRTKFTDRGVRKIMQKYTELAGIKNSISPHTLKHFLFTWLKKKGIDYALIQPYSGHDSRLSLEMYSKLSLSDSQDVYDSKIKDFPF